MPRGGKRKGTPGQAYGQRTDLNQPQAAMANSTSTYGDKAAQQRALQAIPLPSGGGAPPPAPAFDRPSERPGEPLTAGMAIGPGPGPSTAQPAFDPTLEALRGAYLAAPSPALQGLIESRQDALRRSS